MSKFEWQTDEEEWENWKDPTPPPPKRPRYRPSRRVILIILLTLFATVTTTAVQLNRRFTAERNQRMGEALSAHRLILTAAENKDTELFSTLIERNRYPWLRDQERLVTEGLFASRALFDLSPATALSEAPIITSTINNLLDEAVITTAQSFTHPSHEKPIILEQTHIYHLKDGRWLLAEPAASFWGEPAEPLTGRYVTIRDVPQRDLLLTQRLLADFDQTIAHFCHTQSTPCADNFHLYIDFNTFPHLLAPPNYVAHLQESWPINVFFRIIVLPAPSLVGLPQDEAGYQTLKNGYLKQLITAAVNDLTNYRCCDHVALYRALLDHQLNTAGLQTNLLTTEEYDHHFSTLLSVATALTNLEVAPFDPATQQQARLLAAYLLKNSGCDPLTLQQQLLAGESLSGRAPAPSPDQSAAADCPTAAAHISPQPIIIEKPTLPTANYLR